jgi:hypothetical protein
MSAVVQAVCPGCKQVLRIPADWLGQAFKCKHCGMVIQARAQAPAVAPPVARPVAAKPKAKPVAQPVAFPARPQQASSAEPFSFDEDDRPVTSPPRRARRRSGCGALTALILAAAVLGVAAVGLIFAWPYLAEMRAKIDEQVAQNAVETKKATEPAGEEPPLRESHRPAPPPPDTGKRVDPPVNYETPKKAPEKPRPDLSTRRDTGSKPPAPPVANAPFPRRALAISINNYLFANPINYGMPIANSPNIQTVMDRFASPSGLRIPSSQVGILSDAAADRIAVPPNADTIRGTISNFLDTSRAQDRVILLIVGHVMEIEDDLILVGIDGATDSKAGGVPLSWVYERLAACKARQKVLILDTCRLDPSKGMERPGSGPMGAKLDAMLKAPPAGVQVWSACIAEQYSYEFEGNEGSGGAFLEAMFHVAPNLSAGGTQKSSDPLPMAEFAAAVNTKLQEILTPLGKVQTSRLTGSEAEGGAEPNPKEGPPPKPRAVAVGGKAIEVADPAVVRAIMKDISFPPLKVSKDNKALSSASFPPFPAESLKDYLKDGEPTPLRAEVQKARALLADIAGRNQLNDSYVAEAEAQLKMKVRQHQLVVAKVIGELQEQYDALKAAADHRKDETKRWQATYDYMVARMEAQIAYLNEYQAVLGQILKGLAPPDPKVYSGWRLASQYDPQTGDSVAKKMTTEARKKLDKIMTAYPNTPWAIVARRDRASGLGLEWQPMKK